MADKDPTTTPEFPVRTCLTCGWKTTSTSSLDFCIKCLDEDGLRPRHFLTRDKPDPRAILTPDSNEKQARIMRDLLRHFVEYLERATDNGNDSVFDDELVYDDYHAARMLVGQACDGWDSEAAGRSMHRLTGDARWSETGEVPSEQGEHTTKANGPAVGDARAKALAWAQEGTENIPEDGILAGPAPHSSDAPAGRRFPVLYQNKEAERLRDAGEATRTVPWSLLAPHEKQAKKNHDQTLERLAQRGGLSFCEMVAIIEGVSWRETFKLPIPEALDRLKKHMAAHEPIAALRPNDATADPFEEAVRNDPRFLLFQAGHCAGMTAAGKSWSSVDCDEAWRDLKDDPESGWLSELHRYGPSIRLGEAEGIIRDILIAEERGQGLPWTEALGNAATFIRWRQQEPKNAPRSNDAAPSTNVPASDYDAGLATAERIVRGLAGAQAKATSPTKKLIAGALYDAADHIGSAVFTHPQQPAPRVDKAPCTCGSRGPTHYYGCPLFAGHNPEHGARVIGIGACSVCGALEGQPCISNAKKPEKKP